MFILNPVIIAIAKDVSGKVYHWTGTIIEILLLLTAIVFTNPTVFSKSNPASSGSLDMRVFKCCHDAQSRVIVIVMHESLNNLSDALISKAGYPRGSHVRAGEIYQDENKYTVGVMSKGMDSRNSVIPDSLDHEVFSAADQWLDASDLWWKNTTYMKSNTSDTLKKKFFTVMHATDEGFLEKPKVKIIPTLEMSFQNIYMIIGSPWTHKIFGVAAFLLGSSIMVPTVLGTLVQAESPTVKELVLMMGLKKWYLRAAKLYDFVWFSGTSMSLMLILLYVSLIEDSPMLTVLPFCVLGSHPYLSLWGAFVFLSFLSSLFDSPVLATFKAQVACVSSFILFLFTANLVSVTLCLLHHRTVYLIGF